MALQVIRMQASFTTIFRPPALDGISDLCGFSKRVNDFIGIFSYILKCVKAMKGGRGAGPATLVLIRRWRRLLSRPDELAPAPAEQMMSLRLGGFHIFSNCVISSSRQIDDVSH